MDRDSCLSRPGLDLRPGAGALGATVAGLDQARPLAEAQVESLVQALGRYGVLRFPAQKLSSGELRAFAGRFGELEINVANVLYGIEIPRRDGRALGATEFSSMHAAYDGLPERMKLDAQRWARVIKAAGVKGE